MNYVVTVLLGAVLALLVAILLELGKIRIALGKIPEGSRIQPEIKEGRQTVTVNVGALASPETAPVKISESPAVIEPPVEPPPPVVPEEAQIKPAVRPAVFSVKPKSGGLGIVKCPHCGAENTSFRTECFQCGKSL